LEFRFRHIMRSGGNGWIACDPRIYQFSTVHLLPRGRNMTVRVFLFALLFVFLGGPFLLGIQARSGFLLLSWSVILALGAKRLSRKVAGLVIFFQDLRLRRSFEEKGRLLGWAELRRKLEGREGILFINYWRFFQGSQTPLGFFWWAPARSDGVLGLESPRCFLAALPFKYYFNPDILKTEFDAACVEQVSVTSRYSFCP